MTTLIILGLSAWLPFLLLEITSLSPNVWQARNNTPGIMASLGIPPVLIASVVIAFLYTREDCKRNYPSTYWPIWLIPAGILFFANYTVYRYYTNYTIQRDQKLRQELEQRVQENNHPNFQMLADMYQNGWGGSKDIKHSPIKITIANSHI